MWNDTTVQVQVLFFLPSMDLLIDVWGLDLAVVGLV